MRLLLVEDDERIADALAENLTDQNYAVDVVYDGQSGWDYSAASPYDLILLDVMLPEIDGVTPELPPAQLGCANAYFATDSQGYD